MVSYLCIRVVGWCRSLHQSRFIILLNVVSKHVQTRGDIGFRIRTFAPEVTDMGRVKIRTRGPLCLGGCLLLNVFVIIVNEDVQQRTCPVTCWRCSEVISDLRCEDCIAQCAMACTKFASLLRQVFAAQ